MRSVKDRVNSMKSSATTKGRSNFPVMAKSAAQMRGRTGMKNASGGAAGRSTGRKAGGRAGQK